MGEINKCVLLGVVLNSFSGQLIAGLGSMRPTERPAEYVCSIVGMAWCLLNMCAASWVWPGAY